MIKKFMDEEFFLDNDTGIKLYNNFAKDMPIFDYHCHLDPKEISENKKYKNITELWFGSDHYKWRAMRSNGIDEKYITGDASDKEKFLKWAETLPYCVGNPLYHWSYLELKRYFGIDKLLSPETAEEIWEKCNEKLSKEEFTVRNIIKRSNVRVICTNDDPTDNLEHHLSISRDRTFDVKVLPAFRADKCINIEQKGFPGWIGKLSETTGVNIETFSQLKEALKSRIKFFNEVGCRISDHALECIAYSECSEDEIDGILKKALAGKQITLEEIKKYKSRVMKFLGKQYAELGWTMQLHIGCIRNVNKRMVELLGEDTGFDAIGDNAFAKSLVKLMSSLDEEDKLPKTILYCLNPVDNEMVGALIGCFQNGKIPGKIQFGSAWWFNDQKDGMVRQMKALSNTGLLSRFVGMLTDSRSFMSFTRHEYFRRILCNMIGEWVEGGEVPEDMELLGKIVKGICYENAQNYFGISQIC